MAKKKIHAGWAMMRLNKAGNWKTIRTAMTRRKVIWEYKTFWQHMIGHYETLRRAGTLKVVKMYVTM